MLKKNNPKNNKNNKRITHNKTKKGYFACLLSSLDTNLIDILYQKYNKIKAQTVQERSFETISRGVYDIYLILACVFCPPLAYSIDN